MRRNLVKVSFLALALSCLTACGEAEKVTEENASMSDKVILARTVIDSKGNLDTSKIETVIVNKKDIRNDEDIANAFILNQPNALSPELILKKEVSSANNCGIGRRCFVDNGWNNNFYVGESACLVRTGCMWFPGKNILKFAGRVIGAVGEGLVGLGTGLWHGANGGCAYGYCTPWVGANFSYRAHGCSSVSCTSFYAPGAAFTQNGYSYTRYSQVSAPGFSQTDYESSNSFYESRVF